MLSKASYWRFRQNRRLRRVQPYTPSFIRHIEEDIRILKLVASTAGVDPFDLWPFMRKGRGVRAVVESLHLNAPKVIYGPVASRDVPWDILPSSFVVKPSTGSSSRGVFVMRRSSDGRFHDLMKGRHWTADALTRHYQQLPSNWHHVLNDEVLIEEVVECRGRPSYDWKIYAFRGEIALVEQIDRLGGSLRYRHYLPDWSPAPHAWWGRYDREDPLDDPVHPHELLHTAATMSMALPLPFVRVDLYESESEVFVGELTPFPGGSVEHSSTWDQILGAAWERGEANLRVAGVPRYELSTAA